MIDQFWEWQLIVIEVQNYNILMELKLEEKYLFGKSKSKREKIF
jgi:hypothetical protein